MWWSNCSRNGSGTYQGQKACSRTGRALNPEKTYRALKDELEVANTIANRKALADECMALGRFDEANAQYDAILTMPLGDEPGICWAGPAPNSASAALPRRGRHSTSCAAAGPTGSRPTAISSTPAPGRGRPP
jgi:hypothetical protein